MIENELNNKEIVELELHKEYESCINIPSDINEHLQTLYKYAMLCDNIVEFGVRGVVSTYSFLAAKPKTLKSYDLDDPIIYGFDIKKLIQKAKTVDIDFEFYKQNVLTINPNDLEDTDLLFIDTWHVKQQLEKELELFSDKVKKYIILHDTNTFWSKGEDNISLGLGQAVLDFLSKGVWRVREVRHNNNGLLVLSRI